MPAIFSPSLPSSAHRCKNRVRIPLALARLTALAALALGAAGGARAADAKAAADVTYPVDAFVLTYGRENPKLPPLAQLQSIQVGLLQDGDSFSAPTLSPLRATKVSLAQLPPGARFSQTGLRTVMEAIVKEMNRRDIYAAFVVPKAQDIDPDTGVDYRAAGHHALTLVVWVGEIGGIRMLDKGTPLKKRLRQKLLAGSPLHAATDGQPGSLLNRVPLEAYLWRLNDHPGRKIEASLTSTADPGVIDLDYLVDQSRPWDVLAQVSNTGTVSTGTIRTRLSFLDNEVSGRDDIFSLDYFQTDLDGSRAVFASYEKPIFYPNWLVGRVFGSWGNFDSQPVGIAFEKFSGKNWNVGGELSSTIGRPLGITVVPVAGINWQYFGVNSPTFGQSGSVDLLLPYIGVDMHREGVHIDAGNSFRFQTDVPSAHKESETDLEGLGRTDVSTFWISFRDDFHTSLYLDGLFTRSTVDRTNELYFSVSGQFVPSAYRLIPQELDVLGGFFSVRGYPEEVVSADSGYSATAEYRFHVPGLARHLAAINHWLHLRNRTPNSFSDWDLMFRTFADAGETFNNRLQTGEINYDLLSTGIGAEITMTHHFNMRVDGGWALKGIATQIQTLAEKDSFRLHWIATLSW